MLHIKCCGICVNVLQSNYFTDGIAIDTMWMWHDVSYVYIIMPYQVDELKDRVFRHPVIQFSNSQNIVSCVLLVAFNLVAILLSCVRRPSGLLYSAYMYIYVYIYIYIYWEYTINSKIKYLTFYMIFKLGEWALKKSHDITLVRMYLSRPAHNIIISLQMSWC